MTHAITLHTPHGTVTGIEEEGGPGLPLLVCIPGGSYNSHYFDVAGHSFLDAAHEAGFSVVALDRPGYQGSDPVEGEVTFAKNAIVLDAAIAELWKRYADTATGVVLIGHSMGGAIAIHMAGQPHSWPLLGISATSIHTDAPQQVTDAWNSIPADATIPFSKEQRIQFMYGPEGSYDPAVVDDADVATELIPVAELLEVVGGWIADFPTLAAAVTVPVHYALAEHEALWISTDENVTAFGDAFTASPRVKTQRVSGAGHNLDHHSNSAELHACQLEFASSLSA
ncbi:alpha/beta hydrolase [uncultured Microbacterium sp.]|uniref:alpha/beta hydrolase n=1 Tax=uncultured Microbacterium sp. TaxID=191216 RepID=UPI0035CA35B4